MQLFTKLRDGTPKGDILAIKAAIELQHANYKLDWDSKTEGNLFLSGELVDDR